MAGAAFRPSALAGYEDWPGYAPHLHRAGSTTAQDLSDVLGIPAVVPDLGYTIHSETAHDDVITARLSWQLGFGPRTSAWFVRPAHDADTLFAGGFGPVPPGLQAKLYGGRAIATWLAQQGFAVLAHDAFMWGSRRFGLDPCPSALPQRYAASSRSGGRPASNLPRQSCTIPRPPPTRKP